MCFLYPVLCPEVYPEVYSVYPVLCMSILHPPTEPEREAWEEVNTKDSDQ